MTMILLESSLMIVFMLAFRKLCRNALSPRIVYALWLFTAIRMLPVECLFGRDIHMLSLNAFSRLFGKIPLLRDIWFEFSMLRIPWYLLVIWVLGSVAVFLYEHFINFKFEKFLYENRVQIEDENVPSPLYYVPDLRSSCVFKVKGKIGIYLMPKILDQPDIYRTILQHEMCHIRAKDLFWAKLRMIFIAIYWFNPLVYIAAILSKEDCEMACDDRAAAALQMKKTEYGKILLDAVNVDKIRTKEDVFCTATMMVSSKNALRVRVKRLAGKEPRKAVSVFACSAFVSGCILLGFLSNTNTIARTPEQTIRQYVYYSNTDCQAGMMELSLYEKWDYLFPNALAGKIVAIKKIQESDAASYSQNVLTNTSRKKEWYEVEMEVQREEMVRCEKHIVALTKKDGDEWMVDWR